MMSDADKQDEKTKALLDKWWEDWWAQDFSWDGLTKREWEGWSVTLDDAIIETADAPRGARDANLQDYFRWNPSTRELRNNAALKVQGLLWSDDRYALFHIMHVPLRWSDGIPSWKIRIGRSLMMK